jgi:hypothetical protein
MKELYDLRHAQRFFDLVLEAVAKTSPGCARK